MRQESAFGLDPSDLPAVDWLFSDIICYPARLLALVRRWMEAGPARHYCCTIKFQGETDHAVCAEFAAIPGAMVFHGAHNKHEAMFVRLGVASVGIARRVAVPPGICQRRQSGGGGGGQR